MLKHKAEVGPPLRRIVVELECLILLLSGFSDQGPARQQTIAIPQGGNLHATHEGHRACQVFRR